MSKRITFCFIFHFSDYMKHETNESKFFNNKKKKIKKYNLWLA